MKERPPIPQEQVVESASPLVYSREAYERMEKLIAEVELQQQSFERIKSDQARELENDRRIYDHTHSRTRGGKLKRNEEGVRSMEELLAYNRGRIVEYREKLHQLYELAHEEALKENRLREDAEMQKSFQRISDIENVLGHFDPDNIPSAEDQARLEDEYSARARELVDYAAAVFRKDKSA